MKKTGLYILLYLMVCAMLVFMGSRAFAEIAEQKITGYYYDPHSGKVLPKYGNLSPAEVAHYLNLKDARVTKSNYNYSEPNYTLNYDTTSYINKNGQTLRDEVDYTYNYSEPQYQYEYNCDYTSTTDYYYYDNGNIQTYKGTGTEKGDYKSQGYSYTFDDSYDYTENYLRNGNVSDGSYKYYDQGGKLSSEDSYVYSYYDNGNYKACNETGSGYDTATGKKTYTYEYSDNYDINGNWTGYHYVYRDGDGNIIEEYTYP